MRSNGKAMHMGTYLTAYGSGGAWTSVITKPFELDSGLCLVALGCHLQLGNVAVSGDQAGVQLDIDGKQAIFMDNQTGLQIQRTVNRDSDWVNIGRTGLMHLNPGSHVAEIRVFTTAPRQVWGNISASILDLPGYTVV